MGGLQGGLQRNRRHTGDVGDRLECWRTGVRRWLTLASCMTGGTGLLGDSESVAHVAFLRECVKHNDGR